jgi:hypothetical protein
MVTVDVSVVPSEGLSVVSGSGRGHVPDSVTPVVVAVALSYRIGVPSTLMVESSMRTSSASFSRMPSPVPDRQQFVRIEPDRPRRSMLGREPEPSATNEHPEKVTSPGSGAVEFGLASQTKRCDHSFASPL